MFQLRHLHVALALACGLFLAACGGGDSGGSEFVEQFDGFTPDVGPDALIITTTSIPAGTPGVTYPVTSLSVQGSAPVTWQVTEGALPQGLALTSDGRLMGTPAEEGVYEFTARGSSSTGKRKLHEGKMPVCAVSEDATTLVLYRMSGLQSEEVARKEIQLLPDEVNLIRLEL